MAEEPKIVAAVGVAAGRQDAVSGGPSGKARAAAIEAAMRQAVVDASKAGLNIDKDASKVRELMMEYRRKAIEEFDAPGKVT